MGVFGFSPFSHFQTHEEESRAGMQILWLEGGFKQSWFGVA
jgi:hypothetical protein